MRTTMKSRATRFFIFSFWVCLGKVLLAPELVIISHIPSDASVLWNEAESLTNIERHHLAIRYTLLDRTERRLALNNVLHHFIWDTLEHILGDAMAMLKKNKADRLAQNSDHERQYCLFEYLQSLLLWNSIGEVYMSSCRSEHLFELISFTTVWWPMMVLPDMSFRPAVIFPHGWGVRSVA